MKINLLKKEKNNTSTSSLSAGRGSILPLKHKGSQRGFEQNPSYTFPYALREGQTGRSMVEMLGVLAVMGVLSVGGVAMYTNAMNKHKANEILNEASKRAVMVAGQAMAGKTGAISLSEFGNNTVSGATFGTEAKVENNQIKLTLSGIEDSICTKMKAALGDNTVMAVDDNCTIIAFNADMTKGVAKPTSCDPACTGGKECVNGTCQCPDDKPLWIGSTCVAKATCTENQWYNVNTNGCEAKKTCASDEYYWPQLNYCTGEAYCGDAESSLRDYSFAGHVDINDEAQTCACPTGTTAYHSFWSRYPYCCPNNMNIIMGQCISGTCNGTWYCDGELDGSGNCLDSVECCPTGKTLTCNGNNCSCQ